MLPGVSLLDVTTGGFLATDVLNGGPQSEIRVRAATGQVLRRLRPGTPVLAAKWIKGRWLAVTSPDDSVVRVVDSYTGGVTRLAALPRDRFYEPRISPFGAHAADC